MYSFLTTILLATSILFQPVSSYNTKKAPSKNAVLLSDIQTLTLRANSKTSHRRVPALPQLNCVGPSQQICSLYQPDVLRCTNQGYDYDENDIQWTCTAQLPPEFKLGSTDVICEGYRGPDDPWVLKGSCGVEYRMFLTDLGEEKYGKFAYDENSWGESSPWAPFIRLAGFIGATAGIFMLLIYCSNNRPDGRRNDTGGGRGGWGGWGPPGPPPPYDYQPPRYAKNDSWQPGFWSGALGGGAAGYALGNRRSPGSRGGGFRSESSSSIPGPSRATSQSTGFGGTRRR